jgi:hypothetical protein
MLTEDQKLFLSKNLEVEGYFDYEKYYLAQALRDRFPLGIPLQDLLEAVHEKGLHDRFFAISALRILAMVPFVQIAPEIKRRIAVEEALPRSREDFDYTFYLMEALIYLGDPEGEKMFDELEKWVSDHPKECFNRLPLHWFKSVRNEVPKWHALLRSGKPWDHEVEENWDESY